MRTVLRVEWSREVEKEEIDSEGYKNDNIFYEIIHLFNHSKSLQSSLGVGPR